ncbi:MAG TPA: hypothetical protein VGI18_03155 [Burkholderiales bacterium]|jgi:hypothetical protein
MRQGLILSCLLALAGCSITPTKAYQGPSRPSGELSVLKGGGSGEAYGYQSSVSLLAVDGVELRRDVYLASFLPGRRRVELSETVRLFRGVSTQYCVFDLESAAACLYSPKPPSPPSDRSETWDWNVDMPVAVECNDGAAFQLRVPARCGSSLPAAQKGRL